MSTLSINLDHIQLSGFCLWGQLQSSNRIWFRLIAYLQSWCEVMAVESSFINRPISPPKYNQLLIIIVLRFLIIPFVHGGLGDIVASFLFFHITFLIVQSYQLKRSLFILFVAIATVGFLLDIMLTLGWISRAIAPALTVQIIYALFFG